ncbi:MAG: acyl carrier protein [Ruminococcaceae bacterium]|nr:acyl carrier protein [Oscillospiraceae bacterium]
MEIFNKVCVILSELSGTETICLEHELQSDLGLDSLQMVMLLMMLEESFQITLDESDMNPFDLINVWHVVNLVENYVGGKNNEKED